MRKFKSLVALALACTMTFSLCACGSSDKQTNNSNTKTSEASTSSGSDEGKVFNIYCWNDEFQQRVEKFMPDYEKVDDKSGKIGDVTVNWVMTPNKDNAYQNALDKQLKADDTSSDVDKNIDLFLVEADYALKYVDSDYCLSMKDIGVSEDDMKDWYDYTKDIVTDSKGNIKGATWQATPGLFAYRRSIAKDVLGTDDPDAVQEQLSDWDKFDAVAAKASDKGYKMLSGYDDSYRVFSNNVSKKWVDDDMNVQIDDNLWKWVEQTKTYTDKGYNNKTSLWDDAWNADQGPTAKVFGFFYSTWGINFTLLGNALADKNGEKKVGNGAYGDWAVCSGPQSYYWGGTWICAAKNTDNKSLTASIIKSLCCDGDIMTKITNETQDYTNNVTAMNALAESNFKSDFLGGENHIKLFAEAAPKIDMKNIGKYDQGLNEEFQGAMKDYFDGSVDKDKALKNFYEKVKTKYPNLKTK